MIPIRSIILLIIIFLNVFKASEAREFANGQMSNPNENSDDTRGKVEQQAEEREFTGENEEMVDESSAGVIEHAPSELVESHMQPEEPVSPDTHDFQMKRPRRRRRRRRRKRPKTTPNPEHAESSDPSMTPSTVSGEEEVSVQSHIATNESLSTQTVLPFPRRRGIKRRRRPFKRPPAEFPSSSENETAWNVTSEVVPEAAVKELPQLVDEQSLEEVMRIAPEPDTQELLVRQPPPVVPEIPVKKTKPVREGSTDDSSKFQIEGKHLGNPKLGLQVSDSKSPITIAEETSPIVSKKYAKRPLLLKIENTILNEVAKQEAVEMVRSESIKQESDSSSRKPQPETSKVRNETSLRKELLKIRRPPPPSAILGHFRRPNWRSTTTAAPYKDEITTVAEPTSTVVLEKESTSSIEVMPTKGRPELRLGTTSKIPLATTPTTSSTTESTAIIYISCNSTLNEILKSKFNLTSNNMTASPKESSSYSPQSSKNTSSFAKGSNQASEVLDKKLQSLKSIALGELEKLLFQIKTPPGSPTIHPHQRKPPATAPSPFVTQRLGLDIGDSAESTPSELWPIPTSDQPHQIPKSTTPEYVYREPKWFQDPVVSVNTQREGMPRSKAEAASKSTYPPLSKEYILSYTSTSQTPNFMYNDIDLDEGEDTEFSMFLRNNSLHKKILHESLVHRNSAAGHGANSNYADGRKKLPLAVKTAIIISGAILALAILGFFALLLSCKIRQTKTRMKCHRELYRNNFHSSEFRQSSRSTSPVVSKPPNYSGRNFTNNSSNSLNNMQPNMASTRNYYLWQTLRKSFQYD